MSLENFKDGYKVSSGSEIAQNEKNDCVVRALANAFEISYNLSHKFVELVMERKAKKGTQMFDTHMRAIANSGGVEFEREGQLNLFDGGVKKVKVHFVGTSPKLGGVLFNPKYTWTNKCAYTVKEFAQKFNKGTFILTVKKHALTIKNGIIIDNGDMKFNGYRRPVLHAYKVEC